MVKNLLPLHGGKTTAILALLLSLFLLLSSSSCSDLPPLEEAIADASSEQDWPEIVGAHRVLPRDKANAILRRLKKEAGPTDILERHISIMQELSGLPLVAGNKVTLLVDGPATYAAMESAIQSAKDHINFEIFLFEEDEEGQRFADLLLRKQAEGVQVNLIYDSVGCLNTPAAFFKRLRDGGIQTLEVNPVGPAQPSGETALINRDHRKILIVDGKMAFTGGVNISGVYAKSSFAWHQEEDKQLAWRDTDVKIEGPAVADFQKLFVDMWNRQKGPPLTQRNYFPSLSVQGHELVQVLGSEPGEKSHLTYLMYVSAITFASKSVHLTNAYFVPDEQTRSAFENAASRGVDVKLVLPSASDVNLAVHAGRSYYEDLFEAGVKVYERRNAMLHAKTAVIDGVWSTVGSTNMDLWSFLRNYEVNAVILGTDFAGQLEALFSIDLQASNQIVVEEWKKRPFSERLREWFARLLRYWL
jgi:cardiolipin synthase A/B